MEDDKTEFLHQDMNSTTVMVQQPGGSAKGQGPARGVPSQPTDYVLVAILTIIFCFPPVGIFALLRAMQSKDALNRGQLEEARALSERAKILVYWAIGLGIAVSIIALAVTVVMKVLVLLPVITAAMKEMKEKNDNDINEFEKMFGLGTTRPLTPSY